MKKATMLFLMIISLVAFAAAVPVIHIPTTHDGSDPMPLCHPKPGTVCPGVAQPQPSTLEGGITPQSTVMSMLAQPSNPFHRTAQDGCYICKEYRNIGPVCIWVSTCLKQN